MSFGEILGQLLQQGMSGQTRPRLERATQAPGMNASLNDLLGGLLGGKGGSTGAAGGDALSGMLEMARDFLGNKQAGGMSGAQLGGLGALVGALLGGGGKSMGGALGGSAMAILASLALNALQAKKSGMAGQSQFLDAATVQSLAGEDTQRLMVRGMICAAKADGVIDQVEMERIMGKISEDGVTSAEKQMVMDELMRPLDLASLVAEVPNEAVASQLYAASLLAIEIDTPEEVNYLRQLAASLNLDPGTVARLHELTGAPQA